jgi:hypothetical protein
MTFSEKRKHQISLARLGVEARKRKKLEEVNAHEVEYFQDVSILSDSDILLDISEEDCLYPEFDDSSDDSSSSDSDIEDSDVADISAPVSESSLELRWNDGAGKHIRSKRGNGSESTEKRTRQYQRELEKVARGCHLIDGWLERQPNPGLSMKPQDGTHSVASNDLEGGITSAPVSFDKTKEKRTKKRECQVALQDLKQLLRLQKEQQIKYKKLLIPGKDFHRRHLMVLSFLELQQRKDESISANRRRGLATIVAKNYGRGTTTGRKIVQWEKSWIESRTIPEGKAGGKQHGVSWMDDEEILLATQQFIKSQGEGWFKKVTKLLNAKLNEQ